MNLDSDLFAKAIIEKRFKNTTEVSEEFQRELELVMLNPGSFNEHSFEEYSLEEVFTYLKCSHDYYLDVCIPKIENTLTQMQYKLVEDYWSVKLLVLFVQSYKNELISHIEEEEKVLFSFVNNLIQGRSCENSAEFVFNHFVHSHNDNVVIQLAELKKDLLTFDAALKDDLILDILFSQLNIFQKDLMVHGLIEDHVFLNKIRARLA